MKKLLLFLITVGFSAISLYSQQPPEKSYGTNLVATSAITFSSDSRYMIIGGSAKIYDTRLGGEPFRTVKKDTETQSDYSFNVSISPDDRTFLVTKLKQLEIWDLPGQTIKKSIRDNQLAVKAACFSTDGRSIIYMRNNGEVVFLNSSTFAESYRQKITSEKPTYISPSRDGKKLFIGTGSGKIIVFDNNTHNISIIIAGSKGIYNIDSPAAGDYIAASANDGRIWLGRYPSLEPVGSWKAHADGYTAIAFHPSGRVYCIRRKR
jgi:WD40 repeat protein